MGKREDLTGQVFGKLTVIEYMGLDKTKKYAMWKCKCECGGEVITRKTALKKGQTKTCGCSKKGPKAREDLTGRVFERLTVIEYAGYEKKSKSSMWRCKCECGKEVTTRRSHLINGDSKSCGCLTRFTGATTTTHGLSSHPVYSSWDHMKRRCNNPKDDAYENYGGRGIKICEEWNNSFEAFYKDMGDTYRKGLTLERKDVNGDYSPENCVWATRVEQQNNRRNTRYITLFGEKIAFSEVARKYNINKATLKHRLDNMGLSPEEAISTPVGKSNWGKRK